MELTSDKLGEFLLSFAEEKGDDLGSATSGDIKKYLAGKILKKMGFSNDIWDKIYTVLSEDPTKKAISKMLTSYLSKKTPSSSKKGSEKKKSSKKDESDEPILKYKKVYTAESKNGKSLWKNGTYSISQYGSYGAIVVRGIVKSDTKKKDFLKSEYSARWNKNLDGGAGFLISGKMVKEHGKAEVLEKLEETLDD